MGLISLFGSVIRIVMGENREGDGLDRFRVTPHNMEYQTMRWTIDTNGVQRIL